MIQKTHICVFIFDSRSVFVGVVNKQLEGERDYGKQPLATPTFQRSHVCIGVVTMVLVSVNVQGATRFFLVKDRKAVYTCTRSIFVHNKQKH